jgi:hypothetical protein
MRVVHDIIILKKWLFGHLAAWILGGPWVGCKKKSRVAVHESMVISVRVESSRELSSQMRRSDNTEAD